MYAMFFVISCILLSILYTEIFLCFSALQQLIVACSFHPVVYGRVSLLCLHATWTKTLWVIYSGDGELSLPWIPASSGTPKAVISPLLCRSVAVLHRHCLIFMPKFFFLFFFPQPLFLGLVHCSFFIAIVGNSTYVYYDELPVQIPGWWSDQDQGLCQVCISGCCLLSFCVLHIDGFFFLWLHFLPKIFQFKV